jgi:hypothetical protein
LRPVSHAAHLRDKNRTTREVSINPYSANIAMRLCHQPEDVGILLVSTDQPVIVSPERIGEKTLSDRIDFKLSPKTCIHALKE